MTTFDTTLHFLSVLLPTLSVFLFLLLQQRQAIRAELAEAQIRRAARERESAAETQRSQAISNAVMAFAPALIEMIQQSIPRRPAAPPSAADVPDDELVAEVERRMESGDWKQRNPFRRLDDLLEHLFEDGVEVPAEPPSPEFTRHAS